MKCCLQVWHSVEYRFRGNTLYINIPLYLRALVRCDVVRCQGILGEYVSRAPGTLVSGARGSNQFALSSWREHM